MVTCRKCWQRVTLDNETLETDEDWNETNTVYVNGQCENCKKNWRYVLTIEKTYDRDQDIIK